MVSVGHLEEYIKSYPDVSSINSKNNKSSLNESRKRKKLIVSPFQVRVIIIDSITFPIKFVVHESEERLKILLSIHATLRELSHEYNLAVRKILIIQHTI